MKKILFVASIILFGISGEACAQVVMNPGHVSFTASPDHNLAITDPDTNISTPVLDHYELSAVIPNQIGTLMFTQGLGKPDPDGTNTITVVIPPVFLTSLTKNTAYKAIIAAVNNAGASTSAPSNTFAQAASPQAVNNVKVIK